MQKSIQRGRTSGADRLFEAINMTLVILVLIICAYPIYYTIIASFSDPNAVITGKVTLIPIGLTLDSYRSVLDYAAVWRGYRNTLVYTVCGTLYSLFLLLPASYALSRKTLIGRGFLMAFFVFTMYFSGGIVPLYLLIRDLGLIDNPLVLIIPGAFNVYNMIITRTYFAGFPDALREAAKLDGASEFRVFCQIVLPLSGAIVSVMTLYIAVAYWNSFFNALMFINSSEKYPLQMVLRQVLMMNQQIATKTEGMSTEALADLLRRQRMAETMKYALIIIANLPVMAAYPFVQRYFVKGIMIGSLKG